MINEDAQKIRIVIKWQNNFTYRHEQPKRFLLVQMLQYISSYEVHALAIPNGWITLDEGHKHISEWNDVLLNLRLRIVRKSPPQVKFNLVEARIRILWSLISQTKVIVWVHKH